MICHWHLYNSMNLLECSKGYSINKCIAVCGLDNISDNAESRGGGGKSTEFFIHNRGV